MFVVVVSALIHMFPCESGAVFLEWPRRFFPQAESKGSYFYDVLGNAEEFRRKHSKMSHLLCSQPASADSAIVNLQCAARAHDVPVCPLTGHHVMSDVHHPWAGECDNTGCVMETCSSLPAFGANFMKNGAAGAPRSWKSFQIASIFNVWWKSDRLKTQVKSNVTFKARRISRKPTSLPDILSRNSFILPALKETSSLSSRLTKNWPN